MLHFFRASSWSLEEIRKRWFCAVKQYAPLYKEGNLHVLVGDGVKQSKEGRRMPGVKKLFQESENSADPEPIHGHMFGGLGILAGLLGATLSIQFGFTGALSFVMAIVISTPFAILFGGGYGALLNKIKGGEMMVATYVGFSSVSFMCIMWLMIPYTHPSIVMAYTGVGLRNMFSLDNFYANVLSDFLKIDLNPIDVNLVIPTGSLLFIALLCFLMWAFLHTKTGTAMTAVGSNPTFAKASGINVDRIRMLSVILSTWLGAVGILVYQQGFGFVQLYMAPFNMAIPAVAAILIGGASVNKASIGNVVIGTILFQGLVTMTPTVINSLIHIDISEVIRVIVSNGMVVYALTRKTEGGK
jgi:simple sugar transport system permease protein